MKTTDMFGRGMDHYYAGLELTADSLQEIENEIVTAMRLEPSPDVFYFRMRMSFNEGWLYAHTKDKFNW